MKGCDMFDYSVTDYENDDMSVRILYESQTIGIVRLRKINTIFGYKFITINREISKPLSLMMEDTQVGEDMMINYIRNLEQECIKQIHIHNNTHSI
jgi:hypothetical protein